MPWQQHVVDVAYEIDPETGQFVYSELDLTVPRQSGKTTLVLAKVVHRCVGFAIPQFVTYTAQTRNAARKKWEDEHVATLDANRSFKGMYRVRKVNGSEAILWKNGSRYGIEAVKATSGHGDVLDEGVIDEAFAHADNIVEQAMNPGMITRPMRQLVVLSTAGDRKSFYLYRKVLAGRAAIESGKQTAVCYFEWSAEEDVAIDDEEAWHACMPALGHTITLRAIRQELERAREQGEEGEALFRRGYLNQWVDPPMLDNKVPMIIPMEVWERWTDVDSLPRDPVALAIDAAPDLRSACISAAARRRSDELMHIEVVDHRLGTEWLPARLADIVRRNQPMALLIDPLSPAGALIPDIERELGPRSKVELQRVTTSELAQATQLFVDTATGGRLRHRGTPELKLALEGARKRPMGESWAWSRKHSAVDITPLVACTLAVWAVAGAPAPKGTPVFGPSVSVPTNNEMFRPTSRLRI